MLLFHLKYLILNWVQWCMAVIPATQEAEAEIGVLLWSEASMDQKVRPYMKNKLKQ
jgi:hypothetical protein